jgi:hypothetical protein
MNNYKPTREDAEEIKTWLTRSSLKNLKSVFDSNYFKAVNAQIKSMEKRWACGPINSISSVSSASTSPKETVYLF